VRDFFLGRVFGFVVGLLSFFEGMRSLKTLLLANRGLIGIFENLMG
jgi:hypothetical protein